MAVFLHTRVCEIPFQEMHMKKQQFGVVGLGVMGGPMCRNMALKHQGAVLAFDTQAAAFAALEGTTARRAASSAVSMPCCSP